MKLFTLITLTILVTFSRLSVTAQVEAAAVKVLVIMAHPDDESTFSVTLYKIAKEHHGLVDILTITNGEAGYKYSTLAESYYGCELK